MRFVPVLAIALAACGVSGSTPLADLNDKQVEKVCDDAFAAASELEPGVYECDGFSVEIDELDAEARAQCPAELPGMGAACPELVVDDVVGCFEAQADADPCDQVLPPGCEAFFDCLFASEG